MPIPLSGYCGNAPRLPISGMWSGPLGLELFGRGPWPEAIRFLLLRDGELICTGRLRRNRATCCPKFLAALKKFLLNTQYTTKAGVRMNHWQRNRMKLVYYMHRLNRRAASSWYTWWPVRCKPQTHIGHRPRCPHLWASEELLPEAGIEFLEGLPDHLTLVLLFPSACTMPTPQQRVCYYRPLRAVGNPSYRHWTTVPHWVPLDPALTHTYSMVECTSGCQVLVLQPMVPEEVVHGMVGVMEGRRELLLPFLDGVVVY